MPRAPFQILVLPFRLRARRAHQYAVLRRSDLGYWQGIAGGAEDDETPLAAAQREAYEEANVPYAAAYYLLTTSCCVPIVDINAAARRHWPPTLYVIPKFAFAVDCSAHEISLSDEHTSYCWLSYGEARRRLRWDSDRTALWELDQRLRNDDLLAAAARD